MNYYDYIRREKEKIKSVILEMAQKDNHLFWKELIEEQLAEKERKAKITAIVKRDFKRLKAIFALKVASGK